MPEMPATVADLEKLPEWIRRRGSSFARGSDYDAIEITPAADLRYRLYQGLMSSAFRNCPCSGGMNV